MLSSINRWWNEPRPPQTSRSTSTVAVVDVVVALCAVVGTLVERAVRDLPTLSLVPALLVMALVPLRRPCAFVAFCAAFGVLVVANVVGFVCSVAGDGPAAGIVVLLLPWSVFRHGSGREGVVGAGVLVVVFLSALATRQFHGVGDVVGGGVVLALPAVLGATFRFRARAQQQEVETARVVERERLARDLHDTVAHHVSAIVLQAQAGQLVATSKPDAAVRAFAAIEGESTKALRELRALVGVLRDGDAPLSPQAGVDDVCALAGAKDGKDGRVVVSVDVRVDALAQPLAGAVFRIAQEGVTNALRHARGASRVDVVVEDVGAGVRVVVDDDGAAASSSASPSSGFGLIGMAERAALLGGTFHAGAKDSGGWRVEAVLPRRGQS